MSEATPPSNAEEPREPHAAQMEILESCAAQLERIATTFDEAYWGSCFREIAAMTPEARRAWFQSLHTLETAAGIQRLKAACEILAGVMARILPVYQEMEGER